MSCPLAQDRNYCSVIPWIGLAVATALLVWQNTNASTWQLAPARILQRRAPAAHQNATQGIDVHIEDRNVSCQTAVQPAGDGEAENETWPVSRYLQCGDGWQPEYAAMHAAMLRGEVEPRFLVAQGMNGLADSMVGAISMLYVAVLQRRAFFMTFGGKAKYEWAFSQPHVNWTWDLRLGDAHNKSTMLLSTRDKGKMRAALQHIPTKDVRTLESGYATLHVKTMVGFSMRLLDNPHHKDELWRMGIRPATAFACGVDFLLRIRPQALAPHKAQLQALSNTEALKIGIQIRVGDSVLFKGQQDNSSLALYDAFFNCAEQLEASRRQSPRQRVLFYLISDSVKLRRLAAEAFGAKLVTGLDTAVQHSRLQRCLPQFKARRAFASAAAEIWLFSLCNYHIITLHSGFGRLGAYMSGRFHQVFDIDMWQNQKTPASHRSCSPYEYASMEYVRPNSTGLGAPGL